MPTTSSSRNHAALRSAAAGIPDSTTRPPARVALSAVSRDCLLPTASTATSTPPRRYGAENSGLSWKAPVDRRTRRSTSPGCTTSVAPNSSARSRWWPCLATTMISPAGVSWRSASVANRPDRSGAGDEHPVVRAYAGPQRGVHRARERLHEQRLLVRPALGHHVHLAAVRDQLLAPAAAGVLAEPGLQPGREVADGDPRAAVGVAGHAVLARLDAAGRAGEHRVEDDPGAGLQVLAVLEQLGDHLVAGHERQRHDRGEVERGRAPTARRGRSRRCRTAASAAGPSRAGPPWAGRW